MEKKSTQNKRKNWMIGDIEASKPYKLLFTKSKKIKVEAGYSCNYAIAGNTQNANLKVGFHCNSCDYSNSKERQVKIHELYKHQGRRV